MRVWVAVGSAGLQTACIPWVGPDCRVARGLAPAKKVPHFGTQISNIRTFYSDIAAEGGVGLAMTVGCAVGSAALHPACTCLPRAWLVGWSNRVMC
jgi:hypothetical protein